MVLLGLLALALFIGCINTSKVQLLSMKNAMAYANTVAEDSLPAYAIDEEVSVNQPTCFHSRPGHFDPDGFSWLVIDLGIVTWNITEAYLVLNSDTTDISDLEVFVSTRMHSVAHRSGGLNITAGLPWHAYSLCGSATNDHHSTTSVTVHCAAPLHGRWLLVRRRQQPLQVCLLAVYAKKTENRCFKLVGLNPSIYTRANEFRLERHISLDQCRESCAETPSCQGLAFSRLSRRHSTGLCRLFRGPTSTGATDDTENGSQLIKCEEHCRLEQNECNLGRVFSLAQVEAEDGKDEDGVSPIASIWRIEESKDLANGTQLQKTLFAIRFKGRITCEAESCGEVLVVLVNGEGRESICSSIDTDLISVLDGYTIQCSNAVTGSDAVAIKLVPSAKVSTVPKLQLYNGHARFILTPKEEPRSVSTQSIPPEESFGWSFAPSFTASPVVGHSYFTTESSNDQLKNFGLSTKSSHQSGESVDASFEIVLSTTIEEKSSIPFQSTEFGDDSTSDAAVPFKFDRTQMAAESMVPDATVSGADEDFSQLSVSIASTQPTLNQVQPPNPLQNDAEVLSQEVQDVPKEAKANGTVLDLLTAGSGSLSITNLVMIIVIVSIVTIVATAGLAWFFCAHDK